MSQEEGYTTTRYCDFGKGEDAYKIYHGKHVRPEKTRRDESKLKTLISQIRGKSLRDIIDEDGLEKTLDREEDLNQSG